MNREKIAWMFCGVVLTYLALQVPGSFAQRDTDFRFVRTLVDIYRQVGTNYVEDIKVDELQQAAINGMLDALDPHTLYVPPDKQEAFNDGLDGNFKGVGIKLNMDPKGQIEIVTPIDDSPAWEAGVRPGDVLIKVDGESVENKRIEQVIPKIQGALGTKVTLTLRRRGDEVVDLTMERREFVVPMVKGFSRNADNSWNFWADRSARIGYLRLTQFTPDTAEKIRATVEQLLKDGMQGLVLDLRFNPGGRLEEAKQIIDMFISKGTIVSVKGRNRPQQVEIAQAEGTLPDFPMVVLVNEHSASASEVVAGSLRDNKRATVVGARTYGKGSVQEVIPLDANAGELKLTVAYWYLPSGELVQRLKDAEKWGVEPNVVVPMDEAHQNAVREAQFDAERMRVDVVLPTTGPTTRSATQATTQATTQPTTQLTDTQMEKALEVIREKLPKV
jgi:carboxyl-terminal processing protease